MSLLWNQFVHLWGLGVCTVGHVRYLCTRKQQFINFMIFMHVLCMCMLGNANLCTYEGSAHAHKTSECMWTLENTILCTTEVHLHAWNGVKCIFFLRNALPTFMSVHSGLCKVSVLLKSPVYALPWVVHMPRRLWNVLCILGIVQCTEGCLLYDDARKHFLHNPKSMRLFRTLCSACPHL